ncbi:hypothetical protein RZS28_15170 [Methylocapsa polymorpha]|uniref:KAP NTPase domain-containing protein n=1 Tax=Methylocapsa polymorpha TaxID=3080828 RepID=A0ABZ0HQT2_9HYPH|nr:hypothetical protein RZS28_15170 [Methylocapsa sp. RX1]
MPDSGLRDFGAIIPGSQAGKPNDAIEPLASAPNPAIEPLPYSPAGTIFAADIPEAADALGLDASLDLLSQLATHARTETPLAIGLLGRSGSGKSLALTRLIHSIDALSAAARAGGETPFLSKIVTLRIDAVEIDGHPATALAGALHASLAAAFPAFTVEAAHAASDPRVAAREAFERLDAARRKLDAERSALAEAESGRARLTESVLYEATGSQVDAYARANRSRIKTALAALGVTNDPIRDYKDMVRAIADRDGGGRAGFALRAFWAYKGQTRLIATALVLVLAGIGLGQAVADQTIWLGWLRANEQLGAAATWFETHMDWLLTMRQIAFFGAAVAIALNVWRALRLIQIAFRGERLLQADLFARRRESDGHFGHQTRRVEALTNEVDNLTRRAAEAERRAGGLQAANPALAEPPPFAVDLVKQQAQRFIAAVGALMRKGGRSGADPKAAAIETPQRIVLAIDNLDAAPASRAREILAHVRSALGPGFVALVAFDPARLGHGSGEDETSLDKWIQAPFQVGEIAARSDYSALVQDILQGGSVPKRQPPAPDPRQSALDEPVSEAEAKLLAELAPLAGSSARAVKRFVNLYRLARTQARDAQDHEGALALMLALNAGGTQGEIAAMNDALSGTVGEISVDLHQGGLRLTKALAAVEAAQGRIGVDAARRAAALARLFSFNA